MCIHRYLQESNILNGNCDHIYKIYRMGGLFTWVSVHMNGSYHMAHTHANSILSAIVYIHVPGTIKSHIHTYLQISDYIYISDWCVQMVQVLSCLMILAALCHHFKTGFKSTLNVVTWSSSHPGLSIMSHLRACMDKIQGYQHHLTLRGDGKIPLMYPLKPP